MDTPDSNPLDQFVVNLQREKEEELTQKRAAELEMHYKNLVGFQPNPAAVGVIPKDMATTGRVFAFDKTGIEVALAIADPSHGPTVTALKQLASLDEFDFKPYLVSKSSMDYLLSVYDTFAPHETKSEDINIDSSLTEQFSKIENLQSLSQAIQDSSTSATVELLLAGAIALSASDIHIEPESDKVQIRYRLDGVLQDGANLPSPELDPIINRIKLLTNLKLNIKEGAQDGRFSITAPGGTYDIRVSILPTQYGESIVMRLLPQTGKFIELADLGLSARGLELVNNIIAQPNGLILNTGPTGSGKTTTLYAILSKLNQPDRKIITVEDPIEYRLDGITQTQINTEENYSFATALRAIVRQDPDVILVGEIRDTETADIAINASLTGHLVLSTLHTNDAAGSIPRLIDLQAKPAIFADALRLIIAQRLVRKLCTTCRKEHAPTPEEIALMQKIDSAFPTPSQIHSPVGCDQCNGTGYKGRLAIYELMSVTPELKEKITASAPAHELTELAISQGMITLGQDGLEKVVQGLTDIGELLRVINTES